MTLYKGPASLKTMTQSKKSSLPWTPNSQRFSYKTIDYDQELLQSQIDIYERKPQFGASTQADHRFAVKF